MADESADDDLGRLIKTLFSCKAEPEPRSPRAFGYARFSTAGQQETSIERQTELIQEYAKGKGLCLVEVFCDRGISGALTDRPALERLISALAEHPGSILVVEAMDRLFRSVEAFANLYLRLKESGVAVHTVTGPVSEFMTPIHAALASDERDKMVRRLMAGKRSLMTRGGFIGPTPYGYRRAGKGRLEIDPDTAPVVRELFERRAAGTSLGAIVADLNQRGVAPPRDADHWYRSTVSRMLTNPVYVGITVHNVNER